MILTIERRRPWQPHMHPVARYHRAGHRSMKYAPSHHHPGRAYVAPRAVPSEQMI